MSWIESYKWIIKINLLLVFEKIQRYKFNEKNSIMDFIKKILGIMPRKKRLIVAFQGAEYTNCSYAARSLERTLNRNIIETLVISVKSYYKTVDLDPESLKNFEYWNPAAIDWDLMKKTFDDLAAENETVQRCRFNSLTLESFPYVEKNRFPDVIIIEGLYAFNLFSKEMFDIAKLDCFKPVDRQVYKPYIPNPNKYYESFEFERVLFYHEKEEALRDLIKRIYSYKKHKRSIKKVKSEVEEIFEKKHWPVLTKWVYTADYFDGYYTTRYGETFLKERIADRVFSYLKDLKICLHDDYIY